MSARSRILLMVSLLSVCMPSARAADSEVIVERDPVTGAVTMRSKPKDGAKTGGSAASPEPSRMRRDSAQPSAKPAKESERTREEIAADAKQRLRELSGLSMCVVVFGALVCLASTFWTLVVWWKQGVMWFLGGLFLPFVGLIFLIKFWDEAKGPFCLGVAGGLLIGLGYSSVFLMAP